MGQRSIRNESFGRKAKNGFDLRSDSYLRSGIKGEREIFQFVQFMERFVGIR